MKCPFCNHEDSWFVFRMVGRCPNCSHEIPLSIGRVGRALIILGLLLLCIACALIILAIAP